MRASALVFSLILLLLLGSVDMVRAQSGVRIESTDVQVDFPDSLEFRMTATANNVERVQVFWRPVGTTAMSMADADFEVGPPIIARYTVDTLVRYIPPGLDLEYFWRITTSDGTHHDTSLESFLYIDNRVSWNPVEAGLIQVYWHRGTDEFAAEIAHTANRTLAALDDDFGITTDRPIRILIYGNERDFSTALRPNSAEWIGGVAHSSLSLVIARVEPGAGALREIGRMIPHEVAHVVIHHAGRNPYNTPPPWLDEGLATWIQETPDGRLGPILDRAVREGRLIPLPALRSSFPVDPDQAMLSYAQSVSVVSYLVETYGTQKTGDLITIYRSEVTHDEALERTLGVTIEELDANWKAWLGYQGDQVDDPMAAASASSRISALWFLMACGLALFFSGGVVGFFFWRTRAYAVQDDDVEVPVTVDQPEIGRPES